jgi:hypothetical protein
MREQTHLPAMVSFMSNHVAQHFHANWPRPSPAVSAKFLDAPTTAERLREHLPAARAALRQSRPSLLRRAVRVVEPSRNLQVRSRKPHPLAANIVHVRKDRLNAADFAGRFGSPDGGIKMFNKNLIHPLVGGKYSHRRSPELSLYLVLTRLHGSPLLDL